MKTARQREILNRLYEAYDMLTYEQSEVRNKVLETNHYNNVTNYISSLANILQDIESRDFPYREIA